MLRKDFIMVQIEELGKVIAQIISQRNTNAARKNPALIQSVYTSLKTSSEELLNTPIEEIISQLNGEDMAGLQRMEIAAKLLIEDSYEHPESCHRMLIKAKEMLTYIQAHDQTFSLERISLLESIEQQLLCV